MRRYLAAALLAAVSTSCEALLPAETAAPKGPVAPIILDPGHGGIDPGAIGIGKTKEKDVVLAFGLKLKKVLEATGNIDVVMTRSDDTFLPLRDRVKIAREREADLFIAMLSDHEFTISGRLVADATILAVDQRALPAPRTLVEAELLVLDDA